MNVFFSTLITWLWVTCCRQRHREYEWVRL